MRNPGDGGRGTERIVAVARGLPEERLEHIRRTHFSLLTRAEEGSPEETRPSGAATPALAFRCQHSHTQPSSQVRGAGWGRRLQHEAPGDTEWGGQRCHLAGRGWRTWCAAPQGAGSEESRRSVSLEARQNCREAVKERGDAPQGRHAHRQGDVDKGLCQVLRQIAAGEAMPEKNAEAHAKPTTWRSQPRILAQAVAHES
mmetsp:Transcript_261/g.879  ORF Transcript_261/g.879 Transcript_261/m.879 type:complete len:200 (+) Transcript_261:1284-1883(+)